MQPIQKNFDDLPVKSGAKFKIMSYIFGVNSFN